MPKLPLSRQITYAIGQLGWSIVVNLVNIQLVYFYLPPAGSGIKVFITQVVFLVVLNTITLLSVSGRLWDAVTDPFIANLSDKWTGKNGRRIPFLRAGALPAALFCALMFFPVVSGVSGWNIVWLFTTQVLFYIFLTVYVTPYFALLPELGHTPTEKLNLSTYISITYALGIVLAAAAPGIGGALQGLLGLADKTQALQSGIAACAAFGALLMLVPAFTIDELRYSRSKPSTVPLLEALTRTFRNDSFIYYVVADFAYFTGLTIVMTGLNYYITVLLGGSTAQVQLLVSIMVGISFCFYPVVNVLARLLGKKAMISGSFLFMGAVFSGIFFLGRLPISNEVQGYLVVILYALPLSVLGILPNAVLADIAEHDGLKTGVQQEGMFFAARTLMQKFGMTFGVLIFASLTSLGKDPGNDLGIRLSGLVGCGLCVLAGLYFLRYREKEVLAEAEQLRTAGG